MDILVLGAGAMGCIFGGKLALAKHKVVFVDINPQVVDTIDSQGLILEENSHRQVITTSAQLADNVTLQPDLILVFTKVQHTLSALASVQHTIGDNTFVMSLQNGLGNREKLLQYILADRVLQGVTVFPADLKGPGHVELTGSGYVSFFSADGQASEHLEELAKQFTEAGIPSKLEPKIEEAIWSKAIFNAAMNTSCAILNCTPGPLGDQPAGRELVAAMVHEGVTIGRSVGVDIYEEDILAMTAMSMRDHRDHQPSMLQDFLHCRQSEVDALNFAIVQIGKEQGLEAPVTETMGRLVAIRDEFNRQKRPNENANIAPQS